MPVELTLDASLRLVNAVAGPSISDTDLLILVSEAYGHPDFEVGFAELWDLSQVEESNLSPEGIRTLVNAVSQLSTERGRGPCAIVAKNEAVFGMARMCHLLSGQTPYRTGVFRDLEQARAFLEAEQSQGRVASPGG